jgi:hypothetical protein
MGMFSNHCQESPNVNFKLILDQRNGKWNFPNKFAKVQFMTKKHKGKKQETIVHLRKLEATNHESQTDKSWERTNTKLTNNGNNHNQNIHPAI